MSDEAKFLLYMFLLCVLGGFIGASLAFFVAPEVSTETAKCLVG